MTFVRFFWWWPCIQPPIVEHGEPNQDYHEWTTQLAKTSSSFTNFFLVSRLKSRSKLNWNTNIDLNRQDRTQTCGPYPCQFGVSRVRVCNQSWSNDGSSEFCCVILAFVGDEILSGNIYTVSPVFLWSPVMPGMAKSILWNPEQLKPKSEVKC